MLKRYKVKYYKMQKKRYYDRTIITFQQWLWLHIRKRQVTCCFFFYRPLFVKLKFFKKLRKKFRKKLRKKHIKFFFFCKTNFLIHEKFKNSRMGKGKGLPHMWIYKPLLTKPVIILTRIGKNRGYCFLNFFKKLFHPYIIMNFRRYTTYKFYISFIY